MSLWDRRGFIHRGLVFGILLSYNTKYSLIIIKNMMKKLIYALISFGPVLALAQPAVPTFGSITTVANSLKTVINSVFPFLFALAILYFFWGLIEFVRSSGDIKKHEEGRTHMIYGIIAIAVMASIFGLVSWLQGTVGITGTETIKIPTLP
ncbi:MAG: hypothetical protein HY507_00920 [Candidatus Zambryskibacteria bacterium]|nr:hypothetical protein [Candidatus Zambryskibacteria bacterium]